MWRRCRWLLVPTACAVALIALAGMAAAEVQSIPFGDLVVLADEILLGRVVAVVEVPVETTDEVDHDAKSVPLVQIEVLEWFKGKPRPKTLWVWGQGTWVCDVTHFEQGEQAVLFLDRDGVADLVTAPSLERLRKTAQGTPIRRVTWAGRGLMPVKPVAGLATAEIWAGDVRLPTELETLPTQDPRYATFRRFVALHDLLSVLRRQLAVLAAPREGVEARVMAALGARCDPWFERGVPQDELERAGPAGVAMLWLILEDPDSPLRGQAARALDRDERGGEKTLLPALMSEDVRRRRAAAFAYEFLSQCNPIWEDAVDGALDRAARDADAEVRARILWALVRDREEEAFPVLLAGLAGDVPEVAWQAARALREIAYLSAHVPPAARAKAEGLLLALTKHEQVRLRRAAWETLAESATASTEQAALTAAGDADPIVRVHAVCTLGRFRSARSARSLVALLGHPDPWVRRAAAYALGTAKTEAAVPRLIVALADQEESVAALAAWALGELGTKAAAALPALRGIVERGGDGPLAYDAREALGAIEK